MAVRVRPAVFWTLSRPSVLLYRRSVFCVYKIKAQLSRRGEMCLVRKLKQLLMRLDNISHNIGTNI